MELYLHESIQLEQDEYGAMMGAVNVNTNSNTTSKEDNLVASDQTVEDGDSGICDKEQSRGNIHPVEGVEEVQVASELEPELLTTPIAVSSSETNEDNDDVNECYCESPATVEIDEVELKEEEGEEEEEEEEDEAHVSNLASAVCRLQVTGTAGVADER